jgi:TPR repeat protein
MFVSLLQRFGIHKGRAEEQPLERQVTALQAALAKCRDVATRGKRMRHELTAAVAVLMLASGLMLGVYYAPIEGEIVTIFPTPTGSRADAGYTAYQKGSYGTALRILRPLAENGDARAQSTLGLLYYRGGRGVRRDDAEALKWFRLAASRGDAVAELNLGLMYAEGRGVPQTNIEAAKWYRLAADRGNPQAQYNLGLWWAQGPGGAPDYVRAHVWFNLAASRFPESDVHDRSEAVHNRDVVAGKMTSEQIAEAQKRALEWKPK